MLGDQIKPPVLLAVGCYFLYVRRKPRGRLEGGGLQVGDVEMSGRFLFLSLHEERPHEGTRQRSRLWTALLPDSFQFRIVRLQDWT
jgi:hypothetical protein